MIARCGLEASHIANDDRPAWTPLKAVWIALERLTRKGTVCPQGIKLGIDLTSVR